MFSIDTVATHAHTVTMKPKNRECDTCNAPFMATMQRQYWCPACAEIRNRNSFLRYRASDKCKETVKIYRKKWTKTPKAREHESLYRKKKRKEFGPPLHEIKAVLAKKDRRIKLLERFGSKCCVCGYGKCTRSLHIHHIDESRKFCEKDYLYKSFSDWDNLILLCSNCHFEAHEGMTDISNYGYPDIGPNIDQLPGVPA